MEIGDTGYEKEICELSNSIGTYLVIARGLAYVKGETRKAKRVLNEAENKLSRYIQKYSNLESELFEKEIFLIFDSIDSSRLYIEEITGGNSLT